MNTKDLIAKLHWLGHDSFCIDGPPVIYFDPWKLDKGLSKADVVFVSHEHFDHCSPDDVEKVTGPETVVFAPSAAAEKLPGARAVNPGDHVTEGDVEIDVVPAYNVNKFRSPGVPFHPKEAGHVGYIVTVDGARVYFAGDTDYIPEMKGLECDVAMLPVSGTYVMTVEEAVEAAQTLAPDVVVPMHYGAGIGKANDGERFAKLYQGQTFVMQSEA